MTEVHPQIMTEVSVSCILHCMLQHQDTSETFYPPDRLLWSVRHRCHRLSLPPQAEMPPLEKHLLYDPNEEVHNLLKHDIYTEFVYESGNLSYTVCDRRLQQPEDHWQIRPDP